MRSDAELLNHKKQTDNKTLLLMNSPTFTVQDRLTKKHAFAMFVKNNPFFLFSFFNKYIFIKVAMLQFEMRIATPITPTTM